MAAHSWTILKEWQERKTYDPAWRERAQHALDYAPGMDSPEITPEQYRALRTALAEGSAEELEAAIGKAACEQAAKWEAVDKPATAEEWAVNWLKAQA